MAAYRPDWLATSATPGRSSSLHEVAHDEDFWILGVPIFAAVQIIVREVTRDRRTDISRAEAASDGDVAGRLHAGARSLATHAAPEH